MIILIKVENDQPVAVDKISEEFIEDEQWEIIKNKIQQLAQRSKNG